MTSIREGRSSLWALRVAIVATLAAVFAPAAPGAAQPVCEDLELAHRLDGEDLLWNDVKAVAGDESRLAVLTGSAPVLHLFSLSDGALLGSWGREGEGPGEFQSRTGVALLGGRVHALDGSLGRGRLSVFETSGALVRTVPLVEAGTSAQLPVRLARSGSDVALLEFSVPMGNERVVVAATFGPAGEPIRRDTVVAYPRTTGTPLRLTAPDSPSYTTSPPFWPNPRWASVAGALALWRGPGPEIAILGLDGDTVSVLSPNLGDRFEVAEEDREFWLQNEIPQEMFGQRGVFDAVRREARRTVDFPRFHPLALELAGAPNDDLLWVRRTPDGRDQIWDVVDLQGQVVGRVSMAPGRTLMAVLPGRVVAKATDDLGTESVEVYRCGH